LFIPSSSEGHLLLFGKALAHVIIVLCRADEHILRIKRKNTRDKMSALSSLSSETARQKQQQNQFHRIRPSGRIARAHAKRSVVVQNAKTSLSSPTSSASPSSSSSSNEKEEELWLALG